MDGGPTKNGYLMQMQSDISKVAVAIPQTEELSALGAAYLAGIGIGMYGQHELFMGTNRTYYHPVMPKEERERKLADWKRAVGLVIE